MTDNEIIKALECCIKDDCDNCPNGFGNCEHNLAEAGLDLINRQQAEIEGLKTFIEKDQGLILKLTNVPKDEYDNKIKTEAIKEFAEKLKAYFEDEFIDNLVKEMTEVSEE